ncbi:hypothetical protein AHAS_Ahas15G0220600 [Arachis hypogaea]
MLVDEIWHAAGDNAYDIDWYAKRTVLAGIYSTTEIYMLTDTSPGLFFCPFFLSIQIFSYFLVDLSFPSIIVFFCAFLFMVITLSIVISFIDHSVPFDSPFAPPLFFSM